MKSTLVEEKLKSVFTDDEKKLIESKVEETLKWLKENADNEAGDYEKKTKDLEAIFNPIMSRVYQATGGQGMPNMGGMGGGMGGGMPNFNFGGQGGQGGESTGNNTGSSKTNADDVD